MARLARKHWAQFNLPAMLAGIMLLAGAVAAVQTAA